MRRLLLFPISCSLDSAVEISTRRWVVFYQIVGRGQRVESNTQIVLSPRRPSLMFDPVCPRSLRSQRSRTEKWIACMPCALGCRGKSGRRAEIRHNWHLCIGVYPPFFCFESRLVKNLKWSLTCIGHLHYYFFRFFFFIFFCGIDSHAWKSCRITRQMLRFFGVFFLILTFMVLWHSGVFLVAHSLSCRAIFALFIFVALGIPPFILFFYSLRLPRREDQTILPWHLTDFFFKPYLHSWAFFCARRLPPRPPPSGSAARCKENIWSASTFIATIKKTNWSRVYSDALQLCSVYILWRLLARI